MAERAVCREDGEVVGVVRSEAGRYWGESVFGVRLTEELATDEEAESWLVRHGLCALAGPWWASDDGASWHRCWLVEVAPDRVRVSWTDPKYVGASTPEWLSGWLLSPHPPQD